MTEGQRITLMADWWPKACRAQGWKVSDRDLRLRVLSEAVDRDLSSASDLNNTTDIDQVKAHLAGLADNLPPVIKHETPGEDRAVRLRFVIGNELLKCLAVYQADPGPNMQRAEAYLAEIIRDKFQRGSRYVATKPLTIDDLSGEPNGHSQLDQVVMTLSRAVQSKRKAAGDSLHTMKKKAGLDCDCLQCKPRQARPAPIILATNGTDATDEIKVKDGALCPF